ncbi:MAG: GNAT family N-acetyltransferase [Bacteroidales bacterium]|jgi:putative acetyltransferase|nr:GNAT family N-acetyltransferase [Bacteroidales bacterium]
MFQIRKANLKDIDQIKILFKETILYINHKDYAVDEINDWISCGENDNRWKSLINELYFIIAENDENIIIGFSAISKDGYLNSMFVHKDCQNAGVATTLYKEVEKYAINNNIHKITSEVSITALSFFENKGFRIDEEQKRIANKLYLTNYKMSKELV